MNIKATKLFYLNRESKAQIVINRGGSRSSKTFSIGQLLFLERFFTQRNKKILVLRKTLPSLRISVYQDWKKFMDQYDLYNIVEENKQNLDYYYKPNNNYLNFDLEEIHSTYKDNQFLSKDYVRLVESYQHIDFNKYKVYGLGEWGKLENLIYNN